MELAIEIILIIVGFALLVKGADWFVEGAAGIAKKCRVSPLVIGLTVVAFGTSAPELATSLTSAIRAYSDPAAVAISLTNVMGSNITNILLILGLSALIRTLPVQKVSMRLDIPVLLGVSLLLIPLGVFGKALEWWDGLILLAVFAGYMALLVWNARRDPPPPEEEGEEPKGKVGAFFYRMEKKLWFLILLTLVGLGMVVGGSTLLVNGATGLAGYFGVETGIVGLTVVAIGTSLPELVTSVIAAKKGETDIAVGNIIGSNLFNILLIAGVSSLVHPLPFEMNRLVDALVALGAVVLLYVADFAGRRKLGKVAGLLMLLSFVGYYIYLFYVYVLPV